MSATTERALLHDHHQFCFACGPSHPEGLRLHFIMGPAGEARAVWHPSALYQSYAGCVHGGVLATLLDSSMVHGLFAQGVVGVTAEMTVRYLRPVMISAPVYLAGWVTTRRHGLYLCQAEIRQASYAAAQAKAKFMAMPGQVPCADHSHQATPKSVAALARK